MNTTVGVLGYGSLLSDPGAEIIDACVRTVGDVETPFRVEFARSSVGRGGAPTLVPVNEGGARVNGAIYVLDVPVKIGADILYRREIDKVGSNRCYDLVKAMKPGYVQVRCLPGFGDIDIVFYTHLEANIRPRTGPVLACLAIGSVVRAKKGRDGISYLIDANRNGIETPLAQEYEAEILRQTGCTDLEEALRKTRRDRQPSRA